MSKPSRESTKIPFTDIIVVFEGNLLFKLVQDTKGSWNKIRDNLNNVNLHENIIHQNHNIMLLIT